MKGRGALRLELTEPRLFARKALSVFVLAFALLPLVSIKSEIPAILYTGALVVLHVFVLGVYLYRVRFRDLDPDRRSLLARVFALAVVVYLLRAASSFESDAALSTLALQMLGISLLHTAVLLLLMTRLNRFAELPVE